MKSFFQTLCVLLLLCLRAHATAAPQPDPAGKEPEKFVREVIALTNRARVKASLPALKTCDILCASARWQAQDMADHGYFDHVDHQGRDLDIRFSAFGYGSYETLGENIASGQETPAEVVAYWMNSPGHRALILDPQVREIGAGYFCQGLNKPYWVLDLGAATDVYPIVIEDASGQVSSTDIILSLHGGAHIKKTRLSNDGTHWTAWETYQPLRAWTLEAGKGKRTVYVEFSDGTKVYRASDTVALPDRLRVSPTLVASEEHR